MHIPAGLWIKKKLELMIEAVLVFLRHSLSHSLTHTLTHTHTHTHSLSHTHTHACTHRNHQTAITGAAICE
jgi:hypothetical protein